MDLDQAQLTYCLALLGSKLFVNDHYILCMLVINEYVNSFTLLKIIKKM